jgi:hypothetical protein
MSILMHVTESPQPTPVLAGLAVKNRRVLMQNHAVGMHVTYFGI